MLNQRCVLWDRVGVMERVVCRVGGLAGGVLAA